jgi:hypothetical protein
MAAVRLYLLECQWCATEFQSTDPWSSACSLGCRLAIERLHENKKPTHYDVVFRGPNGSSKVHTVRFAGYPRLTLCGYEPSLAQTPDRPTATERRCEKCKQIAAEQITLRL